MGERETRIRDEAYRIWVEAGRPDGDDHRYWYEAEKRVDASDKAGAKAVREKNFPQPAKEAAPEQAPDTGAAKAAGAKRASGAAKPAAPKPADKGVEGAAAAPAPGPAGAARTKTAAVVARNAANSGVTAPLAKPDKGEPVDVAPAKAPKRRR
ncbi:DUF2934 domain-containing protein [Chelatococcus sambhunathii]|uniref:DUF2934 domain-containing protein n=1 Tax=Chelatococcus sambhunathii TaxID=363953 RepID=A0ABU1DJM1_9HYPH|nr:DUF2934 domain-containing protein [Chelatococcus sambhunathii]MDR4308318.1 DUF2934 domain-containing protein [Chelatococcus sambhunathii]